MSDKLLFKESVRGIIEYVLKNGLIIIKLSIAIKNCFINLSFCSSSSVLSSFEMSINFDFANS